MSPPTANGAYRWYVLSVLFLVYVVNFVDRQILSSLIGPIQAELGVSDTAMGLLGGLAFAVLYAVAGIPIARWADTGSRRNVIALAVAVWSGLTAACGTARSFLELGLYRIGVGIGEAGGSAPSHALISDYFPPEQRARALAILSMGIHVGIFIGLVAGSRFTADWRNAFLIVGLPGLLLALLVRFTIREPERGAMDPPSLARARDDRIPTLRETFTTLFGRRSFPLILIGASCAAVSGYAFAFWGFVFFERVHAVPRAELGWSLGLITAFGGGLGTWAGGQLADRLGRRDIRWYAWTSAIGLFATLPLGAATFYVTDRSAALALGSLFLFAGAIYVGPMYAILQGIAPPRMRTMAPALLLFCNNLVGLGMGPLAVGMLSDAFTAASGQDAIRHALLLVTLINIPTIALFLRIARHLPREMEDGALAAPVGPPTGEPRD